MAVDIYTHIVSQAQIQSGMSIKHVTVKGKVFQVLTKTEDKATKPTSKWSDEEDNFLRENLGWMSEEEMAEKLGRTVTAVQLRWKRDLNLTAPSKHAGWVTGNQAADMLGIDGHKISHWCQVGLIPHRILPNKKSKIKMISLLALKMWVVNTNHWIYFDWKKIQDPSLKRLCELKQERWGDEWLPTAIAAKLHGVKSKDVLRLILRGELRGVQVSTSLGGRHKDPRWLNWFVRKSDILNAHFVRGKGKGFSYKFSERAIQWMLKAHTQGWGYEAIARSMNVGSGETIKKKILSLTS